MKYITIGVDDVIKVTETDKEVADYETLKGLIGSLPRPYDWFDLVTVNLEGKRFLFIVDDEGILKGEMPNAVASAFYGAIFDILFGDVIVLSDHGDEEMYFLTDEEADLLVNTITRALSVRVER